MILSQVSHCALVILSELAFNYETRGLSIEEIARTNSIPLDTIRSVAQKLCGSGIIEYRCGTGNDQWLLLCNDPSLISVFDVVVLFESEMFNGRFMDDSGELLPKSKLSRIINQERDYVIRYLRNRYRRVSVLSWGMQAHKNSYTYF